MAQQTIIMGATDGPTLTAAARASCIPTAERVVLGNKFFYIGRAIKFLLWGRISVAITTPGTARYDICMGAAGTTIVYDTGALALETVRALTTVPWVLEVLLLCRAVGAGTTTTFWPRGQWTSEAVIGAPAPTAGGNGSLLAPVGTPAVGAGMDNTAASALDVFFTQTVATGSHTVHGYQVDVLN
jgi:hypothetical protein